MKLSELYPEATDLTFSQISHDSRLVKPGALFFALPGYKTQGDRFIPQAISQGAVAVVGEKPQNLAVPYFQVSDARGELSRVADLFYGRPSHSLWVAGITGTDGKSTTSYLLHHILNAAGVKAGLLSTVEVIGAGKRAPAPGHFTTPEAPEIHRILAEMRAEGLTHVVLETSSHALSERRVANVDYDLAVFTNLSPEHLDHYPDMEAYFRAKKKLFEMSPAGITNADSSYGQRLIGPQTTTYGLEAGMVRTRNLNFSSSGTQFDLITPDFEGQGFLPLLGTYNVYNALAAMSAAVSAGVAWPTALAALASFSGVPGRMQIISREPFLSAVDFAHTPAAIRSALAALRPLTQGKLIIVLGAPGERDRQKRFFMGQAAAQGADLVILSEDDSRSEALSEILAELERGVKSTDKTPLVIPERHRAIGKAVEMAQPGDTLLLAGKGHETTLIRGSETLAWSEAGELRNALAKMEG